jgi:hypothetical protein
MSVGCLLPMARRMPERTSCVEEIIKAVQEQGITVVMAVGMGYFIFFIWRVCDSRNFTRTRQSNYDDRRVLLIE